MNNKKVKILKICFWAYLVINIIINIYKILMELFSTEVPSEYSNSMIAISVAAHILLAIFSVIIKNLSIIIIYIAIRIGIKKVEKEKLSKIDYKNDNVYFRDILKGYSSAELSYIDDFNINNVNDISATLLNLQLKGVLELNQQNNTITVKNNNLELNANETYIINNIKNGRLDNTNKFNYSMRVKEDALKSGLLKKAGIDKKVLIKILVVNTILFFVSVVLGISFFTNQTNNQNIFIGIVGFVLMFFSFIVIPIFTITLVITYILKSVNNAYKRTEIGNEINVKLEGLKNYIKEYSLLKEKRTRRYNVMGRIFNIFYNVWTK